MCFTCSLAQGSLPPYGHQEEAISQSELSIQSSLLRFLWLGGSLLQNEEGCRFGGQGWGRMASSSMPGSCWAPRSLLADIPQG